MYGNKRVQGLTSVQRSVGYAAVLCDKFTMLLGIILKFTVMFPMYFNKKSLYLNHLPSLFYSYAHSKKANQATGYFYSIQLERYWIKHVTLYKVL